MNNSLLEKAQRDYPIGTEYIGIRDGDTETVNYTPRWVEGQDGNIEGGRDYIYRDGEWAKIVMPVENSLPEKWYMMLDNLSDEELELCNEWRRSVCTIRKYSRLESYYTLLNCHSDESYYYGSDCIDTIKAERWANGIKEITFEF